VRIVAYLDANSGSLIASAIAAGFAGVAVVFKVGLRRTATFFSPKKRAEAKEAAAAQAAEAPAAAQAVDAPAVDDAS
jgi:hypothetical protein